MKISDVMEDQKYAEDYLNRRQVPNASSSMR